jgi:hypothetical protein
LGRFGMSSIIGNGGGVAAGRAQTPR